MIAHCQSKMVSAVVCCLALHFTWSAFAQKPSKDEFVAHLIDGEPVHGRLVNIAKSWRITLRDVEAIEGGDLIALRRDDSSAIAAPSGSQVLLTGGDRVRAIAEQATQELLRVNSELLGSVEIPLERVQAILLNPPADAARREQMCRQFLSSPPKHDIVVLANGDQLEGSFLGLDSNHVRLERQQREVEINRAEVSAIAFSSELIAAPKITQLYAKTILADGSELSVLDGWTESGNFRARSVFDREVSVPIEQLAAIEFRNGRLTYLSDLEAADFRHTPYLGVQFDYQRDRSVLGNPLTLRGQLFRKGLGVHSRSELTYAVGNYHRRFEAVVGIDDETAGQGSAVFRVLLDDKLAWESKPLTGRSAAVPVRVELGGAKKLTLQVDFADLGDVQDHADWADARLVR